MKNYIPKIIPFVEVIREILLEIKFFHIISRLNIFSNLRLQKPKQTVEKALNHNETRNSNISDSTLLKNSCSIANFIKKTKEI